MRRHAGSFEAPQFAEGQSRRLGGLLGAAGAGWLVIRCGFAVSPFFADT